MSCGGTCHLWSTGARQEVGLALVALCCLYYKKVQVKNEDRSSGELAQNQKKGGPHSPQRNKPRKNSQKMFRNARGTVSKHRKSSYLEKTEKTVFF